MNNGGEPDLHRVIHSLHLELSEKDRSDNAQIKTDASDDRQIY